MTFKVNDTVRVTDAYSEAAVVGKIGTVVSVINAPYTYRVALESIPSEYLFRDGELIHVTNVRPRGSDVQPQTEASSRTFGTGATRDLDANKLDFEGFLSPLALERYAEHMHKARKMPDGTMRASDNWQLGIPVGVYIKSLWRHFFAVWKLWRGLPVTEVVRGETIVKDLETELCAVIFNASGMLHETLKVKNAQSK